MTPCENQHTTFFEKLQQATDLDQRDRRGKRHELAVVLVGVTLALLSNRDGNLSSIQRHLRNHHEKLCAALGIESGRAISRSQLPLCLEKVSVKVFERLLFAHYGISLTAAEKQWFAIDGKELRGSIESGCKRGAAVVQAVSHAEQQAVAQDYYAGEKESEVPVVRKLLEADELAGQKISLDALHCKPATLEIITGQKGRYLVSLKANQKELHRQIKKTIAEQSFLFRVVTTEKGHGRIETREYEFYDLLEMRKDERWQECQIRTVVWVRRKRVEVKSGKTSQEESYYLSNLVGNYEELTQAIRGHWQVETNNHTRDVSLKEDRLRSKKRKYSTHWLVCEH